MIVLNMGTPKRLPLFINAIARPPRLAGRGAHEEVMVCSSQVGLGTEASFTSDVFVACLFQHSCKGSAGLVREFASFESRTRRTGSKPGTWNLTWDGRAGLGHPPCGGGGGDGRQGVEVVFKAP